MEAMHVDITAALKQGMVAYLRGYITIQEYFDIEEEQMDRFIMRSTYSGRT